MSKRRYWAEGTDVLGTNEFTSYGRFDTSSSPRDTLGHLRLAPQPHTRNVGKTIYVKRVGRNVMQLRGCQNGMWWYDPSLYNRVYDRLYSSAYARFRGKLYEGSAALGVTAGSYKQSADMIRTRYKDMTTDISEVAARSRGLSPKKVASLHLETIFGWKPLLQDIHNASMTVIQKAAQRSFVTARAREDIIDSYNPSFGSNLRFAWSVHGEMRVTIAAGVEVTNPNVWLLERAGLLNPAAVAWDLVPWSFVVNMFVNTGQIVNSMTDFCGLNFHQQSITTLDRGVYFYKVGYKTDWSETQWVNNQKSRVLGSFPRPNIVVKLPDVSWETAAMAASLFAQKFTKFASIAGRLRSARRTYTE